MELDEQALSFFSHVDFAGDCWEWTAGRTKQGYGAFHPHKNTTVLSHRFSYETLAGLIPPGMHIDHLCKNRACCNPDHLEPVGPGENTRRGSRAQTTHCPAGHKYTPENTYRAPGKPTGRRCIACQKKRDKGIGAPRGNPIDPEEVRRLHAEGIGAVQMTRQLHVSMHRLYDIFDELGLARRRAGRPERKAA
jgi:hypothetical protein